jgi:hypothetical protein
MSVDVLDDIQDLTLYSRLPAKILHNGSHILRGKHAGQENESC